MSKYEEIEKLRKEAARLLQKAVDLEMSTCNHPPERRTVKMEDDTFYSRQGCLKCNEWLEPYRLKNP